MKKLEIFLFSFFIWHSIELFGFDRSFFYRSSSFWGEPRFEKPCLSTYELQVTTGKTCIANDECGKKTNIFRINKPFFINKKKKKKLKKLKCLTFPCDSKENLIKGLFELVEVNFNYFQNLHKGIFWHFHVPAVSITITPIIPEPEIEIPNFIDSVNLPAELNKLKSFDVIDPRELSNCRPTEKIRGFSDSTLFLGWTTNYEDTTYLDYIDCTLKLGVLFPTGKRGSKTDIFDIPLGYNGFWGIAWYLDIAWGLFEWLTWGIHNDGVGFIDKSICLSVKKNNKFDSLSLQKIVADLHSGTVWRVGGFLKADHLWWGLSLIMAITYEQKNHDKIIASTNQKNLFFNCNDIQFNRWTRLIYQIVAEYDFAKNANLCNPRIALIYNHQISGKNVLRTNILGGYIGLEMAWNF